MTFRLHVKHLIAMVALVAVGLGVFRCSREYSRRKFEYTFRAGLHAYQEVLFRQGGQAWQPCRGGSPSPEATIKLDSIKAAYHARMSRKWSRASLCPLRPVAPDEPEP